MQRGGPARGALPAQRGDVGGHGVRHRARGRRPGEAIVGHRAQSEANCGLSRVRSRPGRLAPAAHGRPAQSDHRAQDQSGAGFRPVHAHRQAALLHRRGILIDNKEKKEFYFF